MSYSTDEIIQLMEQASKLGVSLELSDSGFSLRVKAAKQAGPAPCAAFPLPPGEAAAMPQPAKQADGRVVKSPIVGTYYAAPAPDKEPFVSIGKAVKKGDVLFIIESMKLMNEVTSEFDGTVREILIHNGQAVEFGQPVLVLE